MFVIRDREGTIRGFHNVCRHRGARLVDGTGTCPTSVTCPYHGWSYRHDGALMGLPVRESFPGLDRAEQSLRPIKVDTAFGFVFVALTGNPAPGARNLGRVGRRTYAVSIRGDGATRAGLPGALERRLEDRDGQLPGVLSRADRPPGTEPHVYAGLRGSAGRARASRAARAGSARNSRRAGRSACTRR